MSSTAKQYAKQYFAVYQDGDDVVATEGRSKRAAALKLAPEGAEGLHVFIFAQAPEATNAIRKAVLGEGLAEPTEQELAEAAALGKELENPVAKRREAAAKLSAINKGAAAKARKDDGVKAGPRMVFV